MLERLLPHVHRFEDACNVYVVHDGDRAVLIDCGSGEVTKHLGALGVTTVDWVLFTHHHRDQCYGAKTLVERGARLAVPQHERYLFENASDYWQQKRVFDNFNDRHTFFTVGENLNVGAVLEDYEPFEWGPYSFFVLPTPGHTQGSSSLILEVDDTRVAFVGDLIHAGGKLYQLHAMENDYGDLAGVHWTAQSIQALRKKDVSLALPSHGPVVEDPRECIDLLDERLHALAEIQRDRTGAAPDGRFAHEVKMEEITPHLLWGTQATCSNFYVIRSESGKGLFIDYPYFSSAVFLTAMHTPECFARLRFTEHHLDELRDDWGIREFDVVIPTHIHDDHVLGIPYLQQHHGTKCWALEDVAKVIESPERWNTPCIMETPVRIDRRLRDRERFEWEGFSFEIVFYPGQTEFHAAIFCEVDGKRVLFAGDSTYELKRYMPEKETEWMVNSVLRNSLTFGMHRKCAEEFERLRPDLVCPGHGPLRDVQPEAYASHTEYVTRKEEIWRSLLPEPAELGIDLFWVRLVPYQMRMAPGQTEELTVELRNPFEREVRLDVVLHCAGIEFTPPEAKTVLGVGAKTALRFRATRSAEAVLGTGCRHLMTAEIRVDGKSFGPVAEALLIV